MSATGKLPVPAPVSTQDAPCDAYGRTVDYLRVSLTDRCTLRCAYCQPAGNGSTPTTSRRAEYLTNDEVLRVVQAAAAIGFRKIRLTGGEPTLRHGLVDLVRAIAATPGIETVAMTSNGLQLPHLAAPLRAAGLTRVNISLDSLLPHRFFQLSGGGNLAQVWQGILAADHAGLHPVRLNTVLLRGYNDDEAVSLAALTLRHAWDVRFIELMPLAGVGQVAQDYLVRSAELHTRIEAAFGPLEPQETEPSSPVRAYRVPGAAGQIGFISSISEPFCAGCNRVRLTADGRLHLCLLHDDEHDLRALLRDGASLSQLGHALRQAVQRKPWGHELHAGVVPTLRGMAELGG